MAKKKNKLTRRARTLQQAKVDAQKSALGIFVEDPYYIHSNNETWKAAEQAAMKQLRSFTSQVRKAVMREFNVLKQIVATREASLFAKLNSSLSDQQIKDVFGGEINRKSFINVLQEAYIQTDIMVQVNEAKQVLAQIPRGDKAWSQLQQIIEQYEKLNQVLQNAPNSFNDSAIALRLQKLCGHYAELKQMNANTQAAAKKLGGRYSRSANTIKVKKTDIKNMQGQTVNNIFGLGRNYLQQQVFPYLYEIGLTQAGMMLCERLGLSQIENKLVSSDTAKGTTADSIVFGMGISVKSTNKIHQVKSRALTTFTTPMATTEASPALNQVYGLAYGNSSNVASALTYLLLNHSVLGMEYDNVLLVLKILSWMSLNEKLFGYNKSQQILDGMTLDEVLQTMPIFTFVGSDQTFVYMGDLLDALASSVLQDFDSIDQVVRSSLSGACANISEVPSIKAIKHNLMKKIIENEKQISYTNIKALWLDEGLKELNNSLMQDLTITLAYTFDWKRISKK